MYRSISVLVDRRRTSLELIFHILLVGTNFMMFLGGVHYLLFSSFQKVNFFHKKAFSKIKSVLSAAENIKSRILAIICRCLNEENKV